MVRAERCFGGAYRTEMVGPWILLLFAMSCTTSLSTEHARVKLRAGESLERKQILSIRTSDAWSDFRQRTAQRLRLPAGALTFLSKDVHTELSGVKEVFEEARRGGVVDVHVMPGALVSLRLIIKRKQPEDQRLVHQEVWVGATHFHEVRQVAAKLGVSHNVSLAGQRQLQTRLGSKLEHAVCWHGNHAFVAAEHSNISHLDPCTCSEGWAGAQRFQDAFMLRRGLLAPPSPSSHLINAAVRRLRRDGFAVLPQLVPVIELEAVKRQRCFEAPDVLKQDPSDTAFQTIRQPLLSCPAILRLLFREAFQQLARAYLGVEAAVGGVNLRTSLVNSQPASRTNLFHSDKNHARFLKIFIYLNSVPDTNSGPFTYVNGSHNRRFRGWTDKYRWSRDEMRKHYGPTSIIEVFGRLGDVIVADTTGFHCGKKVSSQERQMLTVNYQISPESYGDALYIKEEDVHRIPKAQRPLAEFLHRVH